MREHLQEIKAVTWHSFAKQDISTRKKGRAKELLGSTAAFGLLQMEKWSIFPH